MAKCWDLSDAYKQVPLSDNAFELDSYLAVYDPSSKDAKIFKQGVLPFGSIASVTASLRVSLAIWKIGSSLLKLMWSAYFDDFLCLSRFLCQFHFLTSRLESFHAQIAPLLFDLQSARGTTRPETVWRLIVSGV